MVTITPTLISDYIPPYTPLANTAPFTYKDGETYLSELKRLKSYINDVIVPFVNTNVTTINQDLIDTVNALIVNVNDALEQQASDITNAIDTQQTAINNQITTQQNTINASMTALTNYVNLQVNQILNSSVAVQDAIIYKSKPMLFAGKSKAYENKKSVHIAQQYKVLALGDSVANFKWHDTFDLVKRAFGGEDPGASVGNGSSDATYGTWSLPGMTYNVAGGTVATTTDFDAWFSGILYRLTGTSTLSGQIGGATTPWTQAKVYYIIGTDSTKDGGTFKIQNNGVDITTINTLGAPGSQIQLGVYTINQSVATTLINNVNITGKNRIVGIAYLNETLDGAVFSAISQGGISLDDATSVGALNTIATYISSYTPDIITLEVKENSSYYATVLDRFFAKIAPVLGSATFVGIGTTPVVNVDNDQVIQNAQLRAACINYGFTYWDGYTPMVSYDNMVALGWNGDGTHVSDKASSFLGALMLHDLGLIDHSGLARPSLNVNTKNAVINTRLDMGPVRQDSDPLSAIAIDTTSGGGFDAQLILRREFDVVGITKTLGVYSWVMAPVANQRQQIPNLIAIGNPGPRLSSGSLGTLSLINGSTTDPAEMRGSGFLPSSYTGLASYATRPAANSLPANSMVWDNSVSPSRPIWNKNAATWVDSRGRDVDAVDYGAVLLTSYSSRPAATSFPANSMIWDNSVTPSRPIWNKNATTWVDATGATV